MVNTLPAVLIGGPPHAGKSVLTYNLTQALRRRDVPHYVLRASPDGEGDWSQEMDQNTAQLVRVKGNWTPEFVSRMCADLERRQLPLLVDVGGKPKDDQICILRQCTHAILLLHQNDEETVRQWLDLTKACNIPLLAYICSEQKGTSMLLSSEPTIKGSLVGLERGTQSLQGQLFGVLVERLQSLFLSVVKSVRMHLDAVSTEHLVNLDSLLQNWVPQTDKWTCEMMKQLLADLPAHAPLSVYGRGPSWLYGALMAHAGAAPFHQFNTVLGWVTPPLLRLSTQKTPEIQVIPSEKEDTTLLKMEPKYLDYALCNHLPFPPVPTEHGLIISGRIPQWLLTALVRLYKDAGVAWIAFHYPPDKEERAVVMTSRTNVYSLGDLVPLFNP